MCKYTMHLILHLPECVAECGTPVKYSQYWMERYIGWIFSRMNARYMAAASLMTDAKFVKAYKSFYAYSSEEEKDILRNERYELKGWGHKYKVSGNPDLDDILSVSLRSYLIRKYDGLSSLEALSFLETVSEVTLRPRLCFSNGLTAQDAQCASTKLIPGTLNTVTNQLRENWNVACEMFNDGCVEV
ncbi:hypothetical protein BWQ96_07661 [Gracilariopsis chorda]|uniref:DUF4218 domain-containing protein n=1 Tax=Gracilariopsis chorda TaxID=448386 RepID=A0A2V3IKM1_9FLOR|nr:hypothetical protein BWQ96_07661 [Gracilariopsis chorda]|eukprot:PXF42611.1 hypothetical protein BWQ96_07661 [Gracilariopsis chorda]